MAAAILGLGHHLPTLVECGGIRRPLAVEPAGPSVLAAAAARQALERAKLAEGDVDFIVFATMTPDVTFPGAGCFLQKELDVGTIGALDIRAQCAGFLYGLAITDDVIASGLYRTVLVIGAEVHSSGLDYDGSGRETALLFGDGAGAMLVSAASGSAGIRSVVLHGDGRQHRHFWCEYPSSRQHPVRLTIENLREGRNYPKIDRQAAGAFARRELPAVMNEALAAAGIHREDIDCFIVSHVLPEVAETVATEMGAKESRRIVPSALHGHLTAAALPVALSGALESGRIGRGARLCLAAAGAGFSWGAAVIQL